MLSEIYRKKLYLQQKSKGLKTPDVLQEFFIYGYE